MQEPGIIVEFTTVLIVNNLKKNTILSKRIYSFVVNVHASSLTVQMLCWKSFCLGCNERNGVTKTGIIIPLTSFFFLTTKMINDK